MLWVDAPHAGFTTPEAQPWLPLLADWPEENAAAQSSRPRSMLNLYRKLLGLRREHPALHAGTISSVRDEGTLLRFCRTSGEETLQVLINLGAEEVAAHSEPGRVLLTTLLDGEGAAVDGRVTVEAGEGLLILLNEAPSRR